jgi:5'-AMP-activated protein kinase regulatory gamma subunit
MDETRTKFNGLLTTSDYINVIQYYWANPDALREIDRFQLNSLRGMSPILQASRL